MKFLVSIPVDYRVEIEADDYNEAIDKALLTVPNCVEYSDLDGLVVEGIDHDFWREF